MFKKILVCLDGSQLSEQILPFAADEATHHQSQLILFRVTGEPFVPSVPIPGFPSVPVEVTSREEAAKKEEARAWEYLEQIALKLREERQLLAECVTMPGSPGEAIVGYAETNDVDLISIATHGRSGLGRAVFGSVADYILRRSSTPVLLIRPS
jgi:nucleotide-binding universal stress UspA family protein